MYSISQFDRCFSIFPRSHMRQRSQVLSHIQSFTFAAFGSAVVDPSGLLILVDRSDDRSKLPSPMPTSIAEVRARLGFT